jgi:hypothetical protein
VIERLRAGKAAALGSDREGWFELRPVRAALEDVARERVELEA